MDRRNVTLVLLATRQLAKKSYFSFKSVLFVHMLAECRRPNICKTNAHRSCELFGDIAFRSEDIALICRRKITPNKQFLSAMFQRERSSQISEAHFPIGITAEHVTKFS